MSDIQEVAFSPTRAFAEIDTDALEDNYRLLSSRAPRARMIAVVKANAYGHGMAVAVPAFAAVGCRFFAVATYEEAIEVRALAPDADILILGYTPPEHAAALVAGGFMQTIFSAAYAAALSKALGNRRLTVHLKIDGGMCRLGFSPDDTEGLTAVLRHKNLSVVGIYTHFPSADTDAAATLRAYRAFLACREGLEKTGVRLFAHAAASPALLCFPECALDGVRVGLALYGIAPIEGEFGLTPALSLYAPIVQIRRVPRGTAVGYGGDFVASRPSVIGTLPIGYADGVPRAMRGFCLTLLHGGREYPVASAGRICMDQMMVDLTDTPAAVGDRICLWRSAAAPAAHLGTIPYEILTAISPRVSRLAVKKKEKL